MAFSNFFKRTKTYDCLLVDEVPDGEPIIDGDLVQLPLDGDYFVDKHLGLGYTRERCCRPVRITIDKKVKSVYIIARRAGCACGLVMLHEKDPIKVAGTTINLYTDDLILKVWTDPAENFNIQDNEGLKKLTQQNLLGFEKMVLFFGGIFIGWLVLAPTVNFLLGVIVNLVMKLLGGH